MMERPHENSDLLITEEGKLIFPIEEAIYEVIGVSEKEGELNFRTADR